MNNDGDIFMMGTWFVSLIFCYTAYEHSLKKVVKLDEHALVPPQELYPGILQLSLQPVKTSFDFLENTPNSSIMYINI